ncbi:MAG: hypothetical protein ABIJ96_10000 [Elusimicrobiota bacterium]
MKRILSALLCVLFLSTLATHAWAHSSDEAPACRVCHVLDSAQLNGDGNVDLLQQVVEPALFQVTDAAETDAAGRRRSIRAPPSPQS